MMCGFCISFEVRDWGLEERAMTGKKFRDLKVWQLGMREQELR